MNMHANRQVTLNEATRYLTTQSEPFALNYERLDPESLRRLTDRIEAEARQLRAQVLRQLLCDAGAFIYRGVASLFAGMQAPSRRERLSH